MALRVFHQRALVQFNTSSFSRFLSTAVNAQPDSEPAGASEPVLPTPPPAPVICHFRTVETNPVNHSSDHLSRFYTVPKPDIQQLFTYGGLPKKFADLADVFNETSIMVRKPFLELKGHIEKLNLSRPAVRFILYGKSGWGKSLTLAHTLHYGKNAGYLLVHVPWVNTFMRRCKEVSPSEKHPGMMDVPIDASKWLMHFITQNTALLNELKLSTTKTHDWSNKESTPEGTSLLELARFGVARAKYACEVVDVLIQDIKYYSTNKRCKTMVVIDGVNGLFHQFLITERRVKHNARCTLALPFLNITTFDWCNGVVVCAVDIIAHEDPFCKTLTNLPRSILGKEGWEHFDPFIPINVEKFDDDEMNNLIQYYIDRKWLQHPGANTKEGQQELVALSAGSPFDLSRICSSL